MYTKSPESHPYISENLTNLLLNQIRVFCTFTSTVLVTMCWHCACCGINVDPHWFQCGFGSGSSRSKFLRIHGDPDPQHWGTIIFYSYAIFLRYYDFQGIKFLRVTGQKSSASAGLRRPFSHGPSFTVFSASIQCVSNRGQ
jgi:hypothetical protein